MFACTRVLLIAVALVIAPLSVFADDPGAPDTVKINGGPLVVGQSIPLALTVVNDEPVGGYSLGFLFTSDDGGFARYDSVVYIGRMADPTVLQMRRESLRDTDGTPPDSVLLGGIEMGAGNPLPQGDDPIMLIYFTGLSNGYMSIDSVFVPPGGYFILVETSGSTYEPQFQEFTVQVLMGSPPPTVTIPGKSQRVVIGDEVAFDVIGNSPNNFPVALDLVGLVGYDDDARLPANPPTFGPGNPAQFNWTTTAADIGIWLATFRACDTAGACSQRSIDIQVVEGDEYLIPFELTEYPNSCLASGIVHGNTDGDNVPELFLSGVANVTAQLYDRSSGGQWTPTLVLEDMSPKFGPHRGYFNDDDYLDIVLMSFESGGYHTAVFLGDGSNSLTLTGLANDGYFTRNTALGEFTGDDHLDVASSWYDGVRIFAGDGQAGFSFFTLVSTSDSALSVNSADFNGDGFDDLAVGTKSGVVIFAGDGSGGFTATDSYDQTYGSLDIEVTNQGSDFNNDHIFDLCISTPSVAGPYSQMMVYLGNKDGSFTQRAIRTVEGQIFGNTVGDFNGDGILDIGYVNGARRYVAIAFGDGDGYFTNEIRYGIPHVNPHLIDCFDADLDGDIDIFVAANDENVGNSLFLLTNERNPEGYKASSVAIAASGNVDIDITSASGKTCNRILNTIPSGEYFRRSNDQDGVIDDYATIGLVESGTYALSVNPKPNLPPGQTFSLEFVVEDQPYRLAKDALMQTSGYTFTINLDQETGVLPPSGMFIHANPPAFVWAGEGSFDFQLSADIDFTNPIVDTRINGHIFSPTAPLSVTDTAIYFWRVKPAGKTEFDCLYAVNIVASGPTNCGDADGDGMISIADVVYIVNYIFRGGEAPNPMTSGDANCDGIINTADAVYLICYILKGGSAPACP